MIQNHSLVLFWLNRYRGTYGYLEELPEMNIVGTRNLLFCDPEKDIVRVKENLIQCHHIDHESEIIFEGIIDLKCNRIRINEKYDIIETTEIICNALKENSNNFKMRLIDFYNLSLYHGNKFFAIIRDLPRKTGTIVKSTRLGQTKVSSEPIF